jgi:hypothetical protein
MMPTPAEVPKIPRKANKRGPEIEQQVGFTVQHFVPVHDTFCST